MKNFFLIKILFLFSFLIQYSFATQSSYFDKGEMLFNQKKYEKSKFYFEKQITFNPRSEKSYLYLAKIFDINEEKEQLEVNLNNVLLLNPKNEEAVYMLAILKIEQSDYQNAKKLIEKFILICKSLCSKKFDIQNSFNKLIP